MRFPSDVPPRRQKPHVATLSVDVDLEFPLPKWGAVLFKAAHKKIPHGSNVVDLGPGPDAIISRHMIKSGVQANWLAVEPFCSVNAPSEVTVIKGDLRALSTSSVDVILFNPPVLSRRYLNPSSPDCHIFLGGSDGTETIVQVATESQ